MQIRRMLIHCARGLRTPVTLQAVEIVGVHTIIAENTLESDAAAQSRRGVIAHFIHSSPGHNGKCRALGADLPSEIVLPVSLPGRLSPHFVPPIGPHIVIHFDGRSPTLP